MKHKDFAVSVEMPCFMGLNFYPLAEGYGTEVLIPNLCSYPAQEVVSLTVLSKHRYCSPTLGCCETSYLRSAQIDHIRKMAITETADLWVLPVAWRPQRTGGVEGESKTIVKTNLGLLLRVLLLLLYI